MPEELESMYARMNRLERQLRVLKIAAVILAVLAIAMALAPKPEAQQPSASMRVRQLIVEDEQGQVKVVRRRFSIA